MLHTVSFTVIESLKCFSFSAELQKGRNILIIIVCILSAVGIKTFFVVVCCILIVLTLISRGCYDMKKICLEALVLFKVFL